MQGKELCVFRDHYGKPDWVFCFRDIVQGKELCVFRENDSADRATLMTIRQGETTVENAWEIIRK